MAVSEYELLMNGDTRPVQQKGEVVLPKEWRDEHGIEKGDDVALLKQEDGSLKVIPPTE